MRVLVYGAGVIGSLYAARLQAAGHQVTVLARGARLDQIRRHGLVLQPIDGARSEVRVDVVERLAPDNACDLALITVRRDQLDAVVPDLAANRQIATLLFMLNDPVGSRRLVETLGASRVLFGFPGAGGARDGEVVRYALIPQQATTLGEWDGSRSQRLLEMARTLHAAGFKTAISRHIDAWLKTHAFFVTAVSGAIYRSGGDCKRLAANTGELQSMTQGVREGFAAVHALGLPVTPLPLKVLFDWMPRRYTVHYWRRFLGSTMGDAVFGQHARAAVEEMQALARDCQGLLDEANVEAAALQELYRVIDEWAAQASKPSEKTPE